MNDNDETNPLPFVQLAAVTRNVMQFLTKRNDETENESDNREGKPDECKEAKAHRREFLVA